MPKPKHLDTARSLNNMAELYEAMGDYAKAEPLFNEALEIRQKVLGREHSDMDNSISSLSRRCSMRRRASLQKNTRYST